MKFFTKGLIKKLFGSTKEEIQENYNRLYFENQHLTNSLMEVFQQLKRNEMDFAKEKINLQKEIVQLKAENKCLSNEIKNLIPEQIIGEIE